MITYMHGGDFSRNIVGYIWNEVESILYDVDIEMPSVENLSWHNDICDSFGFKGYYFQVFIPNCPQEIHDLCEERIGYFGFKNDGRDGCIDKFDEAEYDLKGIIDRIVSFVRECEIEKLGELVVSLEWGSSEQVKAESEFYNSLNKILSRNDFTDLENYALKAATKESVNYALKLLSK